MGLSLSESGATYLNCFDGYFEQKLKSAQPGSVQRVNKNNEVINVLRFNTLIGKIARLEYKVTDKYGDFWSLTIVDDKAYKLDLPVNSSSTFYFLNRLINAEVDLKAPVELKVFAEVEDDKKKTVILLKQGGKQINGVYTKDNPQDLPQMEKVLFKGKEQWDSSKRDIYLRGIIEKHIVPELDATLAPTSTATDDSHLDGPTDDKDLPDWAKEEVKPAATPANTPPPPSAKDEPKTVTLTPKRRG